MILLSLLCFSLFFNGGFPAFLLVILVLVLVSDWWAPVVVLVMVPFDLTVAAATPIPVVVSVVSLFVESGVDVAIF